MGASLHQQPMPSGHVVPFGARNCRVSNEVWYGSDPPRQGALLRMEVYKRAEAKNHAPLRKARKRPDDDKQVD